MGARLKRVATRVRSHRSGAGDGGSHPPGKAPPPGNADVIPSAARNLNRLLGETDGGTPIEAYRIGGMTRQAIKWRRRGGMADAADLGSADHWSWGFKSPRRHSCTIEYVKLDTKTAQTT